MERSTNPGIHLHMSNLAPAKIKSVEKKAGSRLSNSLNVAFVFWGHTVNWKSLLLTLNCSRYGWSLKHISAWRALQTKTEALKTP